MVATLVRCCDVASLTQPYGGAEGAGPSALPNPYLEPALQGEPLMPLQPQVADLLFNRYFNGIVFRQFISVQVWLLEEADRGGQHSRGHTKTAPVLLLGKPTIFSRSSLRAPLADRLCIHL